MFQVRKTEEESNAIRVDHKSLESYKHELKCRTLVGHLELGTEITRLVEDWMYSIWGNMPILIHRVDGNKIWICLQSKMEV